MRTRLTDGEGGPRLRIILGIPLGVLLGLYIARWLHCGWSC